MLRRSVRRAGLLCAAMAMLAGLRATARQAPTLEVADRLYAEKSYGAALGAYEHLLAAAHVPPPRRDDVQLRVAICLGKSEQWERAIEAGVGFVKAHRGTVWEPRGLYWLGRLYLVAPHDGYRAAGVMHRGASVPRTDAPGAPVRASVSHLDTLNGSDALDAARVLFQQRAEPSDAADVSLLDIDLARTLTAGGLSDWAAEGKWQQPSDPIWRIDPKQPYSAAWPPPKKIEWLFADAERRAPTPHDAALALYARAIVLSRYHQTMTYAATSWQGNRRRKRRYPYDRERPDDALRRIVRDFPSDPVRDQAQLALALSMERDGRMADAETELRQLVAARPDGRWAAEARYHLAKIAQPQLELDQSSTRPPGVASATRLEYRNTSTVHMRICRFDLTKAVARVGGPGASRDDVRIPMQRAVVSTLGTVAASRGEEVAAWDEEAAPEPDHRLHRRILAVPPLPAGAYVLEASGNGAYAASLQLRSDLMLVQMPHRAGVLLFTADARTGKPLAGVELLVRYRWRTSPDQEGSATLQATSDANGLAEVASPLAPGRVAFHVQAFARLEQRMALTDDGWLPDGGREVTYQAYTITDRSVYRPGQTLHFRQILMRGQAGVLKPAAGQLVQVKINGPRGEKLLDAQQATNAYGSISRDVAIPAGCALGEYRIGLSLLGDAAARVEQERNEFRVEEYRKPEFQVSVKPGAARVRLGESASATIHAAYYFGGPVAHAKVHYRVYRDSFELRHRFPGRFDFLDRDAPRPPSPGDRLLGRPVAEGDAKMDAVGDACVEFKTKPDSGDDRSPNDFEYTVQADVQDLSRRTVTGLGSVQATHADLALFADFPHGYAHRGDNVEMELASVDPSDRPVQAAGKLRVYEVKRLGRWDKPVRGRELYQGAWQTDAAGRALVRWPARKACYAEAVFTAADSHGVPVETSVSLWIQGPELAPGEVGRAKLTLQVHDRWHAAGQTAKVLLIAPAIGCTVLVTREVEGEILERRLLHMTSASTELEIPLATRDSPNVFVAAALVRNFRVHSAEEEILVPPADRLATLTVSTERERYQPGERARLRVLARDWQGKPLRTELSLGVTDASLAYIQRDYAVDIRAAFYGDRRRNNVNLDYDARLGTLAEEPDVRRAEPRHNWELPEGLGRLEEWRPGWAARIVGGDYRDVDFRVTMVEDVNPRRGLVFDPYSDLKSTAGRGNVSAGDTGVGESPFFENFGGEPAKMQNTAPAVMQATMARQPVGYDLDNSIIVTGSDSDVAEMKQRINLGDAPKVRSRFADTAYWAPSILTGSDGSAEAEIEWPENLTEWRARAIGCTADAQVGMGETRAVTRKDLLVRLQAPRFFVERDEAVLTAIVHNYQPNPAHTRVRLDLGGGAAELASGGTGVAVELPSGGERRVDWRVRIVRPGTVTVRMSAFGEHASDAAEMEFPALLHGAERVVTHAGALGENGVATVPIDLPAARKPGASHVVVTIQPTLATVAIDAIPYLVDYPYGCIEQTTSRFVPAVIAAHALKQAGIDLDQLRARSGGRGPRNPVFDRAALDAVVADGLRRIAAWQRADGGWGWWRDEPSDLYMTAYVLQGLQRARDAGIAVDDPMLRRGLDLLRKEALKADDLELLAWMALPLARDPESATSIRPLVAGRLFDARERLSSYSRARLALALHALGEVQKAEVVLRNLESTVVVDEAGGTASWRAEGYHWWQDRIEANAAILEAYVQIRPSARFAAMLARWLANNRRANNWNSTLRTALAVEALIDYASVRHELAPSGTVTAQLAGGASNQFRFDPANAPIEDHRLLIDDAKLRAGTRTLTLRREGGGTIYYTTTLRYFSEEEPIRASSGEIAVERRYFRLKPTPIADTPQAPQKSAPRPNPFLTGRYELLEVDPDASQPAEPREEYVREELSDGAEIASGDLIEVEIGVESKNDYEHLLFEDPKPAGCEPLDLRSGRTAASDDDGAGTTASHASSTLPYANFELRDQKVAFFVRSLPQGRHTISYKLRVESPGTFHVLPASGSAMYAPELRALSAERRLAVSDDR